MMTTRYNISISSHASRQDASLFYLILDSKFLLFYNKPIICHDTMFTQLRHLGLILLFFLLATLATAHDEPLKPVLDLEQMPEITQDIQRDKWTELKRV